MDDQEPVDDERVDGRAELLPEERRVGSDDPRAQAEAVLEESDARIRDRRAAPGTPLEQRSSEGRHPAAGLSRSPAQRGWTTACQGPVMSSGQVAVAARTSHSSTSRTGVW